MKQDSTYGSKSANKKHNTKTIVPILYGQHIYIKNTSSNQSRLSLWGRGFIDKNIYMSSNKEKIESCFTIQPKKGLYSFQGKTTTPVVFGAQVLIKHVLSQQYLAIKQYEQIPILEFSDKESSSCYFQFVPLRTFQSNGNIITTDSIFLILHSQRKLYITDLESILSLPDEPTSPGGLSKRISRDETILGSNSISESKSFSGSASIINIQNEQYKDRDDFNYDMSNFKKKAAAKKVQTFYSLQKKDETLDISFRDMSKEEEPMKLTKVTSVQEQSVKKQYKQKQMIKQQQGGKQKLSISSLGKSKETSKSNVDSLMLITPLLNSLPIYKKQANIKYCSLQNYSYSEWKFEHVKTQLKTQYLNNHDYIYFTHSQANQIMTLDIEKSPPEIAYVKNTNQNQNDYILSSIFQVQIEKRNNTKLVFLKHFLTGSYFPIKKDVQQQQKTVCELIPLLSPKKNQYPPFKILFNNQVFQKSINQPEKQNLHGFWLNKIPKNEIAQIMSIQNVKKSTAIRYLKKYLKTNSRRRQKILRQFFLIPELIKQLQCIQKQQPKLQTKTEQNIKQYYRLLFYICKNNEKNKKQCLKYIQHILKNPQKEQILDLLTQLLIDNSNFFVIQKSITPNVIFEQIRQFIKYEGYSISYMRIFRVFCGSDEQPSVRNQCLLFNLFFWGSPADQNSVMSQSVAVIQKKITLPGRFKFKIFQNEGNVYFSNGNQEGKYQDMKKDIISYLRQYFYLLSDCMNGNNYALIRTFTSVVPFSLLLKLLQKQQMKGPVLSLLYNAYLKPQKKYKPHIFHKDYEKICQKGSLISYCGEQEIKLRNFLQKQIRQNKDYTSTMYRLLLNVFKMTIENGYWRKFQDLIDLMNELDGVILQNQSQNVYHKNYEQKAQDRNLLRSKITAISIKIALIDMQVSLWASDYISGVYEHNQIQHKIIEQIKHNKNWVIDEKILRLCSTNSPQLLRKAILLLYKIYNLYKLTNKAYQQASLQIKSSLQLPKLFVTLQLKQQMNMDHYFCIISACLKDPIQLEEISPKNLQKNYRNLQSILKQKQINEQVQNMTYKLGLHEALITDIKRYITLIKKLKQQQEDMMYWKLLTLYAIIRNNLKLRDIISEHRKIFISLIQTQSSHYYVAVDIIEQIYRNNRKLIISDNQELKSLCKSIDFVYRNAKMDLRFCKVVNLLSIFIQTGNRKIVQNHQIILQYVFTKNFVSSIIKAMKITPLVRKQSGALSQNKQQYFRYVLQIVIYDLLVTMNQKKLLSYFQRPSNDTIYALLLGIGTNNWSLKSKVFLCINFAKIKQELVVHLMRIILYDLNIMCQILKNNDDLEKHPLNNQIKKKHSQIILNMTKEVKIYISNIGKILITTRNLFQACQKKLEKPQCQQQVLVIKIIERIFILKRFCPEIVYQSITGLLQFIDQIQLRKKRRNQENKQIKMLLQKIQIGDFQKNQIKQKIPLIYGQKLKNKIIIQNDKQKEIDLQNTLQMKLRMNYLNQTGFQMTQNIIKQLKKLILSLSYVNKSDSTVLSDNIKEFLLNFLRTSFLEWSDQLKQNQNFAQKSKIQMQDILITYQVPTIVCSILQQPFKHRYKLFCSAFELGNKLLQGGHSKGQQKFLQKFRQDNKNWIFQNIYQIIFDSLTTVQFYYHYKEDPTIKSYQMLLQVEQYYTCKQQRKLACQLLAKSFRFLQLLCENDNHIMKEYMYNQLDKQDHIKYMSKNFVEVAQRILDGILKIIQFNINQLQKMPNARFAQQIQKNIFNLPIFILDFLIEVCQIPAEQNQLYLCRTDFFDFSTKLIKIRQKIKMGPQKNQDWNIFFTYERKLIMLLKSLLQQNSDQIENLMRKKIGNQQFQFFIQESFIYGGLQDTQKLKQMLNQMQLNSYVENIVDILIIKKILRIQQSLHFEPQKLKILNELNNRIQSIHVDFKTHSLTVYFPSHPLFDLLSKKTKDFMLDRSAGLTTRRQKLTQLLLSRQVIYQDINNQKNSQRKFMNQQKMEYLFNFALFLCYLIIYLLVMFYSVSKSGTVLDIFQRQIISGLSYMQLIVSAIYTILVGLNTYPVAKEKIKTHLALKKRQNPLCEPNKLGQYLNTMKIIYIDEPQSTNSIILLIISFYACLSEVRVYSFTLIFVFAKIQLLQSILKSIRLTWKQLVFVCFLALVFSFIFGFVTLNYYIIPLYENQQIDIETDIKGVAKHCNTIFTCLSSLYTQKIIGQSVSRHDQEYNYGRFVSDLIYWGFFQVLLSNIIAAIIIDKFAQQRNAKQKIEHERYSKCYICFADRTTLERRGQDFMSHVNHVHNLWNYFFYMYTLENLKDITDFTGIQYWINRQVKQNQIDWIPIDASFKDEQVNFNDLVNKLKPLLAQKQVQQK